MNKENERTPIIISLIILTALYIWDMSKLLTVTKEIVEETRMYLQLKKKQGTDV